MERFLFIFNYKIFSMKKIYILAFLLLTTMVSAQKVNWMTMDEALAAQAMAPKPIMIDMYTNWCGPCKLLDKKTFQNADVAAYINNNYYAVKFNAEGDEPVTYKEKQYNNPQYDPAKASRRNSMHEFGRLMGIRAYPSIVYMDENADVLTVVKSYQTPQQIELYLKLFASGDYKTLKTQESFNAYAQKFTPQFKG